MEASGHYGLYSSGYSRQYESQSCWAAMPFIHALSLRNEPLNMISNVWSPAVSTTPASAFRLCCPQDRRMLSLPLRSTVAIDSLQNRRHQLSQNTIVRDVNNPSAMSGQTGIQPHLPSCRCIVKLGGAAITQKTQYETLQQQTLEAVAQQLKAVYDQHGPEGLIVVHGAGSFGHFQAKQYDLVRGGRDPGSRREGFVLTRQSVTKLQHNVISALIAAGIPACGLSPYGTWSTCNRELNPCSEHLKQITPALAAGMVPVLHGDAVDDVQLGCTILSGDTIVRRLAEILHPQHVVFLTNVPGTQRHLGAFNCESIKYCIRWGKKLVAMGPCMAVAAAVENELLLLG